MEMHVCICEHGVAAGQVIAALRAKGAVWASYVKVPKIVPNPLYGQKGEKLPFVQEGEEMAVLYRAPSPIEIDPLKWREVSI